MGVNFFCGRVGELEYSSSVQEYTYQPQMIGPWGGTPSYPLSISRKQQDVIF